MGRDHQPIRLAEEPAFRLGAITVTPATRQVAWAAQSRTLEPRVMEVLVALAGARGAVVGRDELIQRCWGGRVVGENAINRVVSILRRLAAESGAFALETVTKVGYRLEAGEPYEDGTLEEPARSPWRRRAWRAGIAAILVLGVLGALAWWAGWPLNPRLANQNGRVEFAGFEPRGADAELRRLAAETGEAVTRELTRTGIDTLPVSGGGASGAPGPPPELRIRGTVDRKGENIVIDTEVIDRRSGLVLSASRLARPASAVSGFAEQAGLGVAAALDCALEDRKQSGEAVSPTVFALYLNTCDAIAREGNPLRALASARRLVAAAPKLAIAHALYAIAQANRANEVSETPAEAAVLRRGARQSADKALRLNPRTPKAYIAIANSYGEGSHWAEREQALLDIHRVDPNMTPGRISYLGVLSEVGRLKAAAEVADGVMASGDPRVRSGAERPAAYVNAAMGNLAIARGLLGELERSAPDEARSVAWRLASTWEEPADALPRLALLSRHPNYNPRTFDCVTQFLRELPQRRSRHARGLPPSCDGVPGDRRVQMLTREGDIDGAYAEAAAALATPGTTPTFLFYATMKPFRADPRFMPLAHRVGLVDYWTRSGHWPDFCAEPGLPYDCRSAASRPTLTPH